MKKKNKSILSLNVKHLNKNEAKLIAGGADSEPAVEEMEIAIESWTLDKA